MARRGLPRRMGGRPYWGGGGGIIDPRLLLFGGPDATFTRSSAATYLSSSPNSAGGFLASASANEIRREDWRKSGTRGLYLLEGAAEQLIGTAAVLSVDPAGDWFNATDGVTTDQVTAPDGSLADHVDFGTVQTNRLINGTITLADNTDYTLSVWARSATGSPGALRLTARAKDGTAPLSSDLTVGTDWTRIDFTFNSQSGATSPQVLIRHASDSDAFQAYIWGANLTAGTYPTSTILSQSTRAADVLTFPDLSELNVAHRWTWVPLAASGEHSSKRYIAHQDSEDYLAVDGSDRGELRVANASSTTAALTWDRYDEGTVTATPSDGTVRVQIASSDETDTTAFGGAFDVASFRVGGELSGTAAIDALLEEPVAA